MSKTEKKPTIGEALEKQRIAGLLAKHQSGKTLSRAEAREIAKYDEAKREAAFDEMRHRLKGVKVAEIYRMSPARIAAMFKEGCPRNDDKTYDLDLVIAWREARLKESHSNPTDSKERKMKAEAEYKEAQVAIIKGRLAPIEEFAEIFNEWSDMYRRAGERIQLISPEAADILSDAIIGQERSYRAGIKKIESRSVTGDQEKGEAEHC